MRYREQHNTIIKGGLNWMHNHAAEIGDRPVYCGVKVLSHYALHSTIKLALMRALFMVLVLFAHL